MPVNLQPGDVLRERYKIVGLIGSGGMGAVYRASHAMMLRPTAVKLLPPEKAGEASLARFEREARAVAALNHPNILPIQNADFIGSYFVIALPLGEEALGDKPALAVFQGPDAYIRPSWYASKQEDGRVVPTWNYAVVHARGPITFFEDRDRLHDVVSRLTAALDTSYATWKPPARP